MMLPAGAGEGTCPGLRAPYAALASRIPAVAAPGRPGSPGGARLRPRSGAPAAQGIGPASSCSRSRSRCTCCARCAGCASTVAGRAGRVFVSID